VCVCLIAHVFDLVDSNAWLQYKNEANKLLIPKKSILDLLHFRLNLVEETVRTTV